MTQQKGWKTAVLLAGALLFAGCAAAGQPGAARPAAQAAPAAALAAGQPAAGNMPEHWYAFTALVGEAVVQLPCPVQALMGHGWQTAVPKEEPFAPGEYADIPFAAPGGRVTVRVANTAAAAQPLAACQAVGLLLDGHEAEAAATLAGGVGLGTPRSEVLAAWGSPDGETTAGPELCYSTGRDASVKLTIENEAVSAVELVRWEAPAALPPADTLPPEVAAYEAPEALGDDLWSYRYQYDGDLYTLPTPVATFLQNGWLLRDEGTIEPGGFLMGVSLVRGNQRLRTRLMNLSGTPQPLAGCFVVMVESSLSSMVLPLELPAGLDNETSHARWLEVLGPPDDSYTDLYGTTRTYNYTYYGPDGRLVLRFRGEEMALFDLELWHGAL